MINKPVFSTREVTTEVTVYDGQTVVMGGLMREDIQKIEDKIPILGISLLRADCFERPLINTSRETLSCSLLQACWTPPASR